MVSLTRRSLVLTRKALKRAEDWVDRRLLVEEGFSYEPYADTLSDAVASGYENCPCVFVLSTGRVGTLTLSGLCGSSPYVEAHHEPKPQLLSASFRAYMEDLDGDEQINSIIEAARGESIFDAAHAGRVYVETSNRLTYISRSLAAVFPASKFVHLHRHPYEVVHSGMRRGYYSTHVWDFVRVRPRLDDPRAAVWDSASQPEKNAWYWATVNTLAADFLDTLAPDRRLVVRSQDLFDGDELTVEGLFSFVGVPVPPREKLDDLLGQKLNRQKGRQAVSSPDEWDETTRKSVDTLTAATARRLGYEVGP